MSGDDVDFKAIAAQLAKPTGDLGIKVAANMNISNGAMTRQAIDLLGCADRDHVLEIGPGNGRFADYVLGKGTGVHYTGVDISETMLNEARAINDEFIKSGRARFEWTDGSHFPFADYAFDKIFTTNTLYFWEEPQVQLAAIKRLLKPNGIFCLAIASKSFMVTLPFTTYGFTLYTVEDVQELLLNNGFLIIDKVISHNKISSAAKKEVMREEIFMLAK